ncbi:MAG: hypothetical protein NXI30_13420 [bacterium]|nr:hypothetical protein [bacterium]
MPRKIIGIALFLLGLTVFLIRLQHEGPYFLPEGGNLVGGLLALACGALIFFDVLPSEGGGGVAQGALLLTSLLALYLAAFATLAEVEEVVVVRPGCGETRGGALRLWVIDDDGAIWATMGRDKAKRNGISTARTVTLLRGGEEACVVAAVIDDERLVEHVSLLREDKYAAERIAVALGIFGDDRFESNVALRMGPLATP